MPGFRASCSGSCGNSKNRKFETRSDRNSYRPGFWTSSSPISASFLRCSQMSIRWRQLLELGPIPVRNLGRYDLAMSDIPAARQTLRLLKYLACQSGPVRAATVVRELGIPRSTAYQLIKVMQDEGFLVHFPEDRAYGLSPLMSEIGSNYLRANKVSRLAEPLLEKLVRRTGLPVVAHLGVLHGDDIEYAVKYAAPRSPTLVTEIGVHLPAHLTATGRAILAVLPKEQVRALYPHASSLTTRNGRGPSTLRELDDILAETLARGYAVETGEITAEYASVAVASLDHNAYPAAAVGITFRKIAVDIGLWPQLGAAAQITAGALSMRLRGKI